MISFYQCSSGVTSILTSLLQTKCENYLPEDSETWCAFGDIEVKVDRVINKQGYTLRHLLLRVSITQPMHDT